MDVKSIGKSYFQSHVLGVGSEIGGNSVKSFTRSAGVNQDGGDLMEMAVMQKYGEDNVRYQYIEEPSKRGSFLEEKNEKLVEKKELTQ